LGEFLKHYWGAGEGREVSITIGDEGVGDFVEVGRTFVSFMGGKEEGRHLGCHNGWMWARMQDMTWGIGNGQLW